MIDNQPPSNQERLPKLKRRKIWLTSFGDMAALVLTFFILLFSVSSFDRLEFQGLADSSTEVSKNIKFDKSIERRFVPQSRNVDTINVPPGLSMDYLRLVLENIKEEDPNLVDMIITQRSDRLVISFPSSLLFRTGGANLNRDGQRIIALLAGVINNTGNKIVVAGHTDSTPISILYASNWELSLARATSVARQLTAAGVDTPLDVAGHADGQLKLIQAMVPSEVTNYLARRVDIEILEEERLQR